MMAICKREFQSLFANVIGWLFLAAVMAMYGLYFFLYNMVYGTPTITYTLSAVSLIFLITTPVLTMRVLAEEKRNRTDQLILTAPVSVWEIVCGKFLALTLVLGISVFLIGLTPLLLTIFGTVKLVESYVALLGFMLFGMTCLAIGMFVSSLTESQVISAVVTFILLFIGYIMGSIVDAVFDGTGIFAAVFGAYDLMTPLEDLQKGAFNLVSIVYYLSLIALFLFLTTQSIEKRRWSVSARKLSANVFSVSTIAVVIAATVGLNVIMAHLPENVTVHDVTDEKVYSITKDTKEYIKSINEGVNIYVIGKKSTVEENYPEVAKMLSKYDEGSKHISVTYINTDKNPTFAQKYSDSDLMPGSVIVESAKRFKVLAVTDLYEYEVDYMSYSQKLTAYDGEGQVTGALQYVLSDDMPVIYKLTGHDEVPLDPSYTAAMEKANYSVADLNFLETDGVPADAKLVIVNAPQADISTDDAAKLMAYAKAGGNLFITLDFGTTAKLDNLQKVLDYYKVTRVEGVVAELDKNYYYQNNFYLLPEVESTAVTEGVSGSMKIFSPFSVGLKFPEEAADTAAGEAADAAGEATEAADTAADAADTAAGEAEFSYTSLMKTSDQAVSKKEYASTEMMGSSGIYTDIEKEEGDETGPFTIGLQVHQSGGGDAFVFGSTYLFTDAANQMVAGRNGQLFTNMITSLVTEEDTQAAVVVAAKSLDAAQLLVNAGMAQVYGILFVGVLPLALIISGIVIWYKRKKR